MSLRALFNGWVMEPQVSYEAELEDVGVLLASAAAFLFTCSNGGSGPPYSHRIRLNVA